MFRHSAGFRFRFGRLPFLAGGKKTRGLASRVSLRVGCSHPVSPWLTLPRPRVTSGLIAHNSLHAILYVNFHIWVINIEQEITSSVCCLWNQKHCGYFVSYFLFIINSTQPSAVWEEKTSIELLTQSICFVIYQWVTVLSDNWCGMAKPTSGRLVQYCP